MFIFNVSPALLEENYILLPFTTLNVFRNTDANLIDYAEYVLKDPNNVASFKEAAKDDIDLTVFSLGIDDLSYDKLVGPIENVAKFSDITIITVFVSGTVILLLILMMSIRERKYEIGVLMALGKSKISIVGQFLLEIIFITIIAFGISIISGKTVANALGNFLLNQEISSTETTVGTSGSGTGSGRFPGQTGTIGLEKIDPIDEINVSITMENIMIFLSVGLSISIISIILPAQKILRQNPKQILTNLSS